MRTASDFRDALESAIYLSKDGIECAYVNEPMFDLIFKDLPYHLHEANGRFTFNHTPLWVVKGDRHFDFVFIPW